MNNYVSDEGIVFTDADIQEWASEAESGFPNSTLTAVAGRPWEARTEPMEAHTIRVPRVLWELVEAQAAKRGISASEFTRDAISRELTSA